jgi:hypothetical protein
MNAYVVDENVPIVANDSGRAELKAPQADNACRLACVLALKCVVRSRILIIDTAGGVLGNYQRHLQHKGQPGVGDAFFKHIMDNQYNPKRVQRIAITKNAEREFDMFPADAALATFDRSDRIFVALALAAPERPHILNAVDSDYAEHRAALETVGVHVHEICPQCIRKPRADEGRQRLAEVKRL